MEIQMIKSAVLVLALILLFNIGQAPRSVAATNDPSSVVSDVGGRALASVPNENTAAVRQGVFRQLFRQYFDVEACARAALGPYWLKATAQQRQEFVELYTDYVAISYSTAFTSLGGESFKIVGNRPDKEGVIVTSRIEIHGAAPITLDWQLINSTNYGYKVIDVTVDGISMASRQHSELISVLQRNGGQISALLVAMRDKNASNGVIR
jgi:phospholipid transport system substrate-binding protein